MRFPWFSKDLYLLTATIRVYSRVHLREWSRPFAWMVAIKQ